MNPQFLVGYTCYKRTTLCLYVPKSDGHLVTVQVTFKFKRGNVSPSIVKAKLWNSSPDDFLLQGQSGTIGALFKWMAHHRYVASNGSWWAAHHKGIDSNTWKDNEAIFIKRVSDDLKAMIALPENMKILLDAANGVEFNR